MLQSKTLKTATKILRKNTKNRKNLDYIKVEKDNIVMTDSYFLTRITFDSIINESKTFYNASDIVSPPMEGIKDVEVSNYPDIEHFLNNRTETLIGYDVQKLIDCLSILKSAGVDKITIETDTGDDGLSVLKPYSGRTSEVRYKENIKSIEMILMPLKLKK